MKKIVYSIATLFVTFILFSGCNNEVVQDDLPNGNIKQSVNPYEYIGELHNEMLLEWADYNNGVDSGMFDSTKIESIVEWVSTKVDPVDGINPYEYLNFSYEMYSEDFTLTEFATDLFNNDEVSAIAKNYLIELEEIVLSSGSDISLFLDEIIVYETKVGNIDLTAKEHLILLSAASIARNSLSFWYEANNNPSHPYHVLFANSRKINIWWKIGIVDICGGVMGGLWGGPWGIVIGAGICSGLVVLVSNV
ncbi:hypothetical protein TBC1_112132 [Lentimicrobium saccharophilum]|uniref:Uncharacterized protein n=1 Tax=Lentimicrobium saccharophilum TaxID=1678841 RepID=A0A0S7BSS8_9BACT|nr:hypothetical protein [Lentimicrobium saccharophilum]GAP43973.1 hypothetical protein TBC1_112132 [Lentimicrobium saccharophilum]